MPRRNVWPSSLSLDAHGVLFPCMQKAAELQASGSLSATLFIDFGRERRLSYDQLGRQIDVVPPAGCVVVPDQAPYRLLRHRADVRPDCRERNVGELLRFGRLQEMGLLVPVQAVWPASAWPGRRWLRQDGSEEVGVGPKFLCTGPFMARRLAVSRRWRLSPGFAG